MLELQGTVLAPTISVFNLFDRGLAILVEAPLAEVLRTIAVVDGNCTAV